MMRIAPVALAALAIGCGGSYGSNTSYGSPPACTAGNAVATTDVNAAGMSFSPSCIKVTAPATVTFHNVDAMPHTATADDGSFDQALAAGQSKAQAFTAQGTVPYHCTLHAPYMTGTVIVQ
jgi:plastocyanin